MFVQELKHLRRTGELGRGGEGCVYEVVAPSGDRLAYKEYKLDVLKRRGQVLERKLRAMVASPPREPSLHAGHHTFMWPTALVVDGHDFRGFLMPLLAPNAVKLIDVIDARARKASGRSGWNWGVRVAVGHNLAQSLSALHRIGGAYGDLHEENVFVDKRGLITLLDLDAISFKTSGGEKFPGAGVARDDWRPPECMGKYEYTHEGDNWSLAVQLYMLLMESTRPFAVLGRGDLPSIAVARGDFPLLNHNLRPPLTSPPLDTIPPAVAELFKRAFGPGRTVSELRPRPEEYAGALKDVLSTLRRCDRVEDHVWAAPRSTCPWCERLESLSGGDQRTPRTAEGRAAGTPESPRRSTGSANARRSTPAGSGGSRSPTPGVSTQTAASGRGSSGSRSSSVGGSSQTTADNHGKGSGTTGSSWMPLIIGGIAMVMAAAGVVFASQHFDQSATSVGTDPRRPTTPGRVTTPSGANKDRYPHAVRRDGQHSLIMPVEPATDWGAKRVLTRVSASCHAVASVDGAGDRVTYEAKRASDGKPRTAWRCSGRGGGRLQFQVRGGAPGKLVRTVGLIPGYAKVDSANGKNRFRQNHVIVGVQWRLFDGKEWITVNQRIRRPKASFSRVRLRDPVRTIRGTLTVTKVEPGKTGRDFTPVSEIALYG